jgi:UDP-N-acetylglucosamine--N-acetylmuramyl-(pentapeptide) pyrophosphoryl-undecaprenol N-acetylglucosamine transferase
MTSRPLSIVIAGGGTGGHLYPGVAVARALLARVPDARVSFAGTARGIEARVVPQEGFELDLIRAAGLKGKSLGALWRGLFLLPAGLLDAWGLLSRRQPHVVIGVGGYSSGPVVLLAALRGRPTMVLEQNAVPGLTNRWLARVVRSAAVTYEGTRTYFRGKAFVSGNPVRPEFMIGGQGERPAGRPPRLLVLGGSQGAHAINVAVAAAVAEWTRRLPGLSIVHQTGTRDVDAIRRAYADAGVTAVVEPFLDRVADVMRDADIVISRAGATTLAELAALGVPAVLVPFPAATDDHQRKNAEALVQVGAAHLVLEHTLSTPAGHQAFADLVLRVLTAREEREAMRRQMAATARLDAADRIVDRVLELAA